MYAYKFHYVKASHHCTNYKCCTDYKCCSLDRNKKVAFLFSYFLVLVLRHQISFLRWVLLFEIPRYLSATNFLHWLQSHMAQH
jgi:hypothetical protein